MLSILLIFDDAGGPFTSAKRNVLGGNGFGVG